MSKQTKQTKQICSIFQDKDKQTNKQLVSLFVLSIYKLSKLQTNYDFELKWS